MRPFKGPPGVGCCASCPYSQKDLAVDPRGPYECHLNPPAIGTRPFASGRVPIDRWPLVDGGDWCGSHPEIVFTLKVKREVHGK
jgi:hypothetical protein